MSKIQEMFSARGRRMFTSEREDAEAFNTKYTGASVGPKPAIDKPAQKDKIVTYRDSKSGEEIQSFADAPCRENAYPLILNGRPIQQLSIPQKFLTSKSHADGKVAELKASDLGEIRAKFKAENKKCHF